MEYVVIALVAALVFGICFLADKGFQKLFRNKEQHKTGLCVKLSKRYGSFGVILTVLGISGIIVGLGEGALLIAGGCLLILVGLGLAVYYLSFGVYYDQDTFLVTGFGNQERTYRFEDIQYQQLYTTAGGVVIELSFADGQILQLQTGMDGMYPFMDHAFDAWLRQKGLNREDCEFHDPQNSCWFPTQEA